MFLNVLVNTARHGKECRPVIVEAVDESGDHLVTITNEGEPIPTASLEWIFKPLVQLENAVVRHARPRTSLGLGLYTARTIAGRHGGSIVVASGEADGTRFIIRLPTG
jgi:signal transduction histidine kinase